MKSNQEKIFITGGVGFVGVNLVDYLLTNTDYSLTIFDNFSTGVKDNLTHVIMKSGGEGRVTVQAGDIVDQALLQSCMAQHTAVIHLAAHTQVLESIDKPDLTVEINSVGTFNVMEAARKNDVLRFIFASSNAAVGEQIPPINESMVPRPLSPYGASKLYGEALCSSYFHSYDMQCVALRFANVYGPYSQNKNSVIAKFIRRIKAGQKLEIYGDGHQTRDFIHVSDIGHALYLALLHAHECPGGVFQIATGIETSIYEVAKHITQFMEKDAESIYFSEKRKGEIVKNYSDISKAQQLLGFQPHMEFVQGLEELCSKGEMYV